MGRTCITHWGVQEYIQGLGEKASKKETTGRTRRMWRIILKWVLLKVGWYGMYNFGNS
jgi:hypothetical protein